VRVAVGHTRCTEAEFDDAIERGATLVTHLFNGMSGVHHREPGVATFAVTSGAFCSLIADGVHVDPRVLRLAFSALGPERAVLVTDAVAWRAGTVSGIGIELRDGAPRLPDGTLAGSAVTMDAAVRQCVAAGIPLEHALRAASENPATVLGLTDRGRLEPGLRADVVALTPDLRIAATWVAGRQA
jgi:N-acetylglucosamine-6-phosphate deacetylase